MRLLAKAINRERFEEIAGEIGVAERFDADTAPMPHHPSRDVRFLGTVDQQRLVAAYRIADLFVMASTRRRFWDHGPAAMASGKPALGLDDARARGAVGEGKLGAVIPKEDDLPDAITRLIVLTSVVFWVLSGSGSVSLN
jgi:glycosyltransferase involved in cell wall biosynthesis